MVLTLEFITRAGQTLRLSDKGSCRNEEGCGTYKPSKSRVNRCLGDRTKGSIDAKNDATWVLPPNFSKLYGTVPIPTP